MSLEKSSRTILSAKSSKIADYVGLLYILPYSEWYVRRLLGLSLPCHPIPHDAHVYLYTTPLPRQPTPLEHGLQDDLPAPPVDRTKVDSG